MVNRNNVDDRINIIDAVLALGYEMKDIRHMSINEILEHVEEFCYLTRK